MLKNVEKSPPIYSQLLRTENYSQLLLVLKEFDKLYLENLQNIDVIKYLRKARLFQEKRAQVVNQMDKQINQQFVDLASSFLKPLFTFKKLRDFHGDLTFELPNFKLDEKVPLIHVDSGIAGGIYKVQLGDPAVFDAKSQNQVSGIPQNIQ